MVQPGTAQHGTVSYVTNSIELHDYPIRAFERDILIKLIFLHITNIVF